GRSARPAGRPASRGARDHSRPALPGGTVTAERGHRRRPLRRARPGSSPRELAGRLGAARAQLGLSPRDRLSDGQAAVLYTARPFPPGVLEQLRPPLPGPGAGDGRPAAAPLRGLSGRAGESGASGRAVCRLPGGVPPRDAAARRLRDWTGALDRPRGWSRQHPWGGAVSPRPQPAVPVAEALASAVRFNLAS